MNCSIYTVSCNFVIHAICLLKLMMYKYSELQVSGVIQKLSCKASCKTPFFFIVLVCVSSTNDLGHTYQHFLLCKGQRGKQYM
jgi:hypothetical protein